MSVPEGGEEASGALGGGEHAPWSWTIGPTPPAQRPADLLSGFGGNPVYWPASFDLDRLGPVSTEQWANDYCWADTFDGPTEATWGRWATLWPLPVGRRSIVLAFPPSGGYRPARIVNAVPWDGDEHAAFIHTAIVGPNTVTTFCLVDRLLPPAGSSCDLSVMFSKGGSRFVIRGPDPTGPAVSSYVEHARAWWRQYGILRLGAGRPLGSTARTLEDYRAVYRLIYGEDLRPPTRDEFVARSDIPETTLKRNLRSWGYSWSSFSAECQQNIARAQRSPPQIED